MATTININEKIIPPDIIKWAKLEKTTNDLLNNFEEWKERNAELINRFFNQPYFLWEESIINKFSEIQPDLDFDYIKDEWINLALIEDNNWIRDFKNHLDKINNDNFKKAFIEAIYEKLNNKVWWLAPYSTDFSSECDISHFTTWTSNVLSYFQKIISYLKWKESAKDWKKTSEILKDVFITNEDINNKLATSWENIPTWTLLTSSSIPATTKNAFDILLSFEIGKEAHRTINIAQNITRELESLFINSLPAVNTIIWENDDLKFDENQLWEEYNWRLEALRNDTSLNEWEKNKQINDLKREFYLQYAKKKNKTIGDVLEQLYNNNFDYSKIEPSLLESYLDKIADMRLKMLFNKWLNNAFKLDIWNVSDFENYYKWLAKCSLQTIPLDPSRWISLPVEKKITEWEHPWLKDINEFWKTAKSYDTLPITYKIKKSDIDSLPIDLEDRTKLLIFLSRFTTDNENYIISWWDVWMLLYLFFVINSKTPITNFDPDKQKEVENLFWQAKEHEEKWWDENNKWENNSEENEWKEDNWENTDWEKDNSEENNQWNEELSPDKFKENIEKLWSGAKFENWSEIWLPMGKSELPGWWFQRMKIKISNVNMAKWTFTGTVFWWELKLNDKLEWKSKEFEMNKKFIDDLKDIAKKASANEENQIWLLPNPDNINFNSFIDSLNNKLWTSSFSFPAAWTTWDGSKFLHKTIDDELNEKEVETKYFWASWDDKSTYKIEYNPIRKSFTVSSTFNWDGKNKKWETEKKRFSYKRDMDRNNFLIFFTQKWLHPQSEEESNNAIRRQDQEFKMVNWGNRKLNWFSFNNIKNVFKTITWNIKKKIDDYDKNQEEKLQNIVLWDRWLYSGLAKILWFIPSMKYGLWELQQEYYNERDNRTWKKIEYYLKLFQADPDFWTTFENLPPHAKIQEWKSLQKIVTNRVKNAKDRMWDPWIYQAAALLLANIEKWSSPYRWLAGKENTGLWVKALLGKGHYKQFMIDKQNCIDDLKAAWKEKDQIQDVLATCEMDYIINNVSWANWKLKYFGSHEKRWTPWKEGTDYIDNPSKKILSNQFADKLKAAYKGRFNKSSVEEALGKITHNDFNLAKEDFKRFIKSSRFPSAVANLKKMFLLAKNEEQQAEYQKCFLLYMLSGVLDVNGKKDLRKQTYQWAKTMSFLPGMLAKETCHSQKVATLLDDWSWWKFSENVKSYFHEGDLKNWLLKIDKLSDELDERWGTGKKWVDSMNDFEKYSKSEFLSKSFTKDSVLEKLQDSAKKPDIENIDNTLLENPLVANSWWLLSNINVVDDRIQFKNWEFDWKDPDEKNNRQAFWVKIKEEINNKNANSVEDITLLLNQYFNRFKFSDREEIYKWIKTASEREKEIWKKKYYEGDEKIKDYMWTIWPEEIESIIRYAFKWHTMYNRFNGRLPDELNDVLDAFQKKFKDAFDNKIFENPNIISNVFNIGNAENVEPYGLWSWSRYKRAVTDRANTVDIEGDGEWKWKTPKEVRNRVKRNFTSWNFINKKIADMETSFKKLPDKQYKKYINATVNDLMSRFYDDDDPNSNEEIHTNTARISNNTDSNKQDSNNIVWLHDNQNSSEEDYSAAA